MVDNARLTELYLLHRKGLCGYIYKFLWDADSSEDILQETFLSVINYSRKYVISDTYLKSFLYKTARNLCINFIKKNRRVDYVPIDGYMDFLTHQKERFSSDSLNTVDEILPLLFQFSDIFRNIFIMRIMHCLSNKEIASIIGMSERTVRRRMTAMLNFLEINIQR